MSKKKTIPITTVKPETSYGLYFEYYNSPTVCSECGAPCQRHPDHAFCFSCATILTPIHRKSFEKKEQTTK